MGTVGNYVLLLISLFTAIFGYVVRKFVSAISLGISIVILASSTGLIQLAGATNLALAIPSATALAVGFLFHRASIALSSSLITSYVASRLAGVHLDLCYLISISIALAVVLYVILRKREYVPYVLLGTSASSYFIRSLSNHVVVAAVSAILVGLVGYLAQSRVWRVRSRYEKMRLFLKKRRSLPRGLSAIRKRGSRESTSRSL
ncbi:MAG: hypothetical protein NZ925_01280 [Sulfolobales archaeon]|nr:hypothetical protein [Sulfolobales archaeon]